MGEKEYTYYFTPERDDRFRYYITTWYKDVSFTFASSTKPTLVGDGML